MVSEAAKSMAKLTYALVVIGCERIVSEVAWLWREFWAATHQSCKRPQRKKNTCLEISQIWSATRTVPVIANAIAPRYVS